MYTCVCTLGVFCNSPKDFVCLVTAVRVSFENEVNRAAGKSVQLVRAGLSFE